MSEVAQISEVDLPDLAEMHVASWRETYTGLMPDSVLDGLSIPKREAEWREALRSGVGATFISRSEGRLVGFISVCPARDEDADHERTGEVSAIYVLQEMQGSGLGYKLWQQGLEWLREQGLVEVTTWVLDTNITARSFYERAGCTLDGKTKPVDLEGAQLVEVRYRAPL